ncbi:peptidoglycan DD-metalloendopeptidase family protein [Streptomyces sp. NBC_01429]|uniref:peptidoglycan DD-metalloendopeptidase family protein n=1 Tax=Streptomyces sp. NBC_01429 TaxID=2903862 RepID=UPI002E2A94C0|nr:peptidoglycan DD-metalloendopeptidase family protein [Streptomyces sp. NBC_01429]
MPNVVGQAAVDVIPIVTNFHSRLLAAVLPAADRVGRQAGERMGDQISRHIVITLPDAVTRGGQAATRAAARQGDDAGGAFSRSLRNKLTAAFKAMPKLDVRLSDTGVDAELARLRAKMEQLSNKRIGIDIDAATASAQIRRIEAELKRLGAQHPNVQVRADTAAARAQLAQIHAAIAAVDARDPRVKVHVDTSGATNALLHLGIQIAALAAIPLGPVLLAGTGAVVAMATAGTAALGSLALASIPAIKGVADVVKLKTEAENESSSATDRGASIAKKAASSALQQASAQQTLTAAHRNAARSIAQSNRAIEDAERGVSDAVQRAADSRRQAAETIRRAQQSLADAHRNVSRAEEALTDSQRDATSAQKALTEARADAEAQLAALNDRLLDGMLDQREATLRVEEAQLELQRVMNDPRSTELQVERAQLASDQAVKRYADQEKALAELRKTQAEQQRAGVDGNAQVVAAQDRVAAAQRAVRDRTEGVADAQRTLIERSADVAEAQRKSARAQTDAARSVADAQRRVADAVENAANAQTAAAESITSAERGIESARLSSMDTTTNAISKQDEYRKALAAMTPEARDLFDAFAGPKGLKSAFSDWSRSLEPTVLPLFTRGVTDATSALPGFTPLVESAAGAITTLYDKAEKQLKTPFWRSFTKDLKTSAEPALVGFGVAFGNTIKGIAGIIDAFLPHMGGIADESDRITERFAKWGSSLKGSPKFEKFLDYVKETSPGLAEFIGDILGTALDLTKAVAPLSTTMFGLVSPVLDAISSLATNSPGVVQALWGMWAAQKAIALGMAAFGVAMGIYNAVMIVAAITTGGFGAVLSATGILPIIRAVVIVVGLLAAGLVLAYNKVDWFRAAVDGTWAFLKEATSFLWGSVLNPAFDGIWAGLQAIGDAAVWLWNKAIRPSFDAIGKASKPIVTALIVLFLTPAYIAFKALGEVAKWLWNKAIGPAFSLVGEASRVLWEKYLRPHLRDIAGELKTLGGWAKWFWKEGISPAFSKIGDGAKWLYNVGIKKPFDNIRSAIRLVADSFDSAQGLIQKAWTKIKGHTKGPVKFVIDTVYNGAIVPLWEKVAKLTGADPLKPFHPEGYHTGGIMSGYSPGRDDRIIAVGGGEAVMRPEWTRAIGAERINAWNAAARSGGIGGVQRAIASGMPAFRDGGVVGWLKDKTTGVLDTLNPAKLFDRATSWVKEKVANIGSGQWGKAVAKIPGKMISSLKDRALSLIGFGGGDGGGSWMKPVNAPFGTPFGKSGSMWSSGKHTGLDFPAAVGAAVKAVDVGKVALAQGGGPYGNHVMINHGKGLTSLYAHLSQIATKVGETVTRGQRIGAVGATGNVTGPHLHLEARRNGAAIDPMQFLGGGSTSYKPSAGVSQWRGVVQQALAQVGQPKSYTDITLRRMQQESGGNPNAVNKWDVNWLNGHPSVGLMQVIRPTFERFAGKYKGTGPKQYGVSTNPLANIYSSMTYALAQYGSLPSAYNRPGGYASGGFPALGEMAWVGENGPELVRFLHPAQVYSSTESASMARTQASARDIYTSRSAAGTQLHADVKVYVGTREITDIVRTEIDIHDLAMADGLNTGGR